MFPPSSQAPKRCRKITCSILHQNNSFAWWKQLEGAQARAHPSGFSQINAVCCDTCAENSLEQFLTEPLQQCWHRGALWKCSPGLGCSSHPCWREWLFCLLCLLICLSLSFGGRNMWRGNGASVVLALPSSPSCAAILGAREARISTHCV